MITDFGDIQILDETIRISIKICNHKTYMTPSSQTKKKKIVSVPVKKVAPRVVKPSKPEPLPNPSLKLYRRIAGAFIVAVLAMLVLVILLSTTKAVIAIDPKVSTVESSFLFDVVKESASDNQILGNIIEQTFEQAKTFPVMNGEQKEVLDKAGGTVTLINNSSRTQPLVATTRLLSSGGVLFRLDKGVTVPANGSVTAVVHADQVGSTGDIGPDKFTIPGLATSLQTVIYAESSEAMSGGKKMVSAVGQTELDQNAAVLQTEMEEFVYDQLRLSGKANWTGEAFVTEIVSKASDTEPGEEKSEVTISMKLKVIAVFFNTNILNSLASAKLYQDLEDGFAFKGGKDISYDLQVVEASEKYGIAQMRAEMEKEAIVSNTHQLLQPEYFVGKTMPEIKNYLISAGLADDVSVWIFPPWNKRVPAMVDHVTVEVKE